MSKNIPCNPLHSKEEIDSITLLLKKDADKLGTKSRFGYFSIPYNSTLGDGHYAHKADPPARDEHGRVITKQRNIQTTIPKSGKAYDVYFSNIVKEEPKFIQEKAKYNLSLREKYIEKIKLDKEKETFKQTFKPGGPQERKDYFKFHPFLNKEPIFKDLPKTFRVDKATHKIIIENKNILTQPMKKGTSSFPGILFSYPKTDKKQLQKLRSQTAVNKYHKVEKGKFSQPFKPSNTHLNGYFYNDKKQYALPESTLKDFQEKYVRSKSAGHSKFMKEKGDAAVSHLRAFRPASNMKHGEKGYFSQRYGVPFVPHIDKKRKESSKGKFHQEFK